MNIENNQFQAFEPEPEAKAFIYQMVQELENEVSEMGSLSVFVEKEETINTEDDSVIDDKFAVTFVIDPENLNLKVRAESKNFFSACMTAKNAAASKLNQMLGGKSSQEEREERVQNAIGSKGYIH